MLALSTIAGLKARRYERCPRARPAAKETP